MNKARSWTSWDLSIASSYVSVAANKDARGVQGPVTGTQYDGSFRDNWMNKARSWTSWNLFIASSYVSVAAYINTRGVRGRFYEILPRAKCFIFSPIIYNYMLRMHEIHVLKTV